METIKDGYYFMFEIGWFMDLLIPTIVRVQGGNIHFVGSKSGACKDLKPCCVPCGGAEEVKTLAVDDPAARAFKTAESLVPVSDTGRLEEELARSLQDGRIRDAYFNTRAKEQREATLERIVSDCQVLSQAVL